MKKLFILCVLGICIQFCFSLDLQIFAEDTLITKDPNGGFNLYIKKKPDVASVLITETTEDKTNEVANYAYRSPIYNSINGNEKRMLNGAFLSQDNKLYSLIDSTPEYYEGFGLAFHIWIPEIIEYGYEWTRHGTVKVEDGLFLNIRAFEKPYADYTGTFVENPFLLRIVQ